VPVRQGIPLLVVVAGVFLTAGWAVGHESDDDGPAAAQRAEGSDDAPAVTTTTIDPDLPSPENPLRVVLAGDSVMSGLTPPLTAALESSGAAEVRFLLTPSILRDATVRFTWQRELEDFNPDVIVMFVGTWELGQLEVAEERGQGLSPDDPGWREVYDTEVLDPWIEFITGNGAEVVWISTPAVDNDLVNASYVALNQAFVDAADRWDEVTFVDGGHLLGDPAAGYPGGEVMFLGTPLRTRQIDGLHLCADGAALLAADVLELLGEQWMVPVEDGWDDGAWRTDPAYPPENCPAPQIG
jgi:hypothetical protein